MTISDEPVRTGPAQLAKLAAYICKKMGGRATKTGWKMRCPAHDDGASPLTMQVTENGVLSIQCDAGCREVGILRGLRAQ